jgi:hypothetical protein
MNRTNEKVGFPKKITLSGELPDLFGHPALPHLGLGHGIDSCYLRVRVMKISPADQKEVIKGMADLAQCGNTCCWH